MKALLYIRCSTEEQADSGLGLESQRQRLAAYCVMRGLEIVDVHEDAGYSAGKPLSSRPAGSKMLQALRSKTADAVVILKLDRGFRNTIDCLQTVEAWTRKGIALHIVDLGGNAVDTTSAAGKFMLTVMAAVAQMERDQTRERTKGAMTVKRGRGERISGRCPYGWTFAPNGNDKEGKQLHKLVEDSAEQVVLARIRELRAAGLTLRAIAQQLNAEHIPAKEGGPWNHQSVASALARKAA